MRPNFTRVKFWLEGRVQFLTDDGAVLLMHYTTCGYFESR